MVNLLLREPRGTCPEGIVQDARRAVVRELVGREDGLLVLKHIGEDALDPGLGFRVEVWGLGFRVQGSGFRVEG